MNLTIKQIDFVIESILTSYRNSITVSRTIKDDAYRLQDLTYHADVACSKLDGISMLPCVFLGSRAFQRIQDAKGSVNLAYLSELDYFPPGYTLAHSRHSSCFEQDVQTCEQSLTGQANHHAPTH